MLKFNSFFNLSLITFLLAPGFGVGDVYPSAEAAEKRPMHWSADLKKWDRRENTVELIGNAVLNQPGESLKARRILLDLKGRTLSAWGDCNYKSQGAMIQSDELHMNLDTRTGSILNGRVYNDRFLLTGERINKLGLSRFQAHRATYTTCHDCPRSWTFFGGDIDLEIEGYAYISNAQVNVKDAPVFWLPYIVIPIKTKRQTGFLFPKFSYTSEDGWRYMIPFFWATTDSTDMTFGFGGFMKRGRKFDWEGRYMLTPWNRGQANFYFMHEWKNDFTKKDRWGLNVEQTHMLPWRLKEQLRLLETSDNLYVQNIGDLPGKNELGLSSDLILSKSSLYYASYVQARRFRNYYNLSSYKRFDGGTVQLYPALALTTNDRFLFGTPIASSLSVGLSNFARSGGQFDRDPNRDTAGCGPGICRGVDPVRAGTRFFYTPLLYGSYRPFDVLSLVPSVQYRGYAYSFGTAYPGLSRGYLLLQSDAVTQLEKVYKLEDTEIPRSKHLIRPYMKYSLIPVIAEQSNHPFLKQIRYSQSTYGSGGYQFDNLDIVPRDATKSSINYFYPLGNAVSYGFTTQLIRRHGDDGSVMSGEYRRAIEWTAGQAYNFRELRAGATHQPFSRAISTLNFDFEKYNSVSEYSYQPYKSRYQHTVSTTNTYTFIKVVRRQVLQFQRSVSLSYYYNGDATTNSISPSMTYSLNDYILPTVYATYNSLVHQMQSYGGNLQFQSPSRCWKLTIRAAALNTPVESNPRKMSYETGFEFALNLTGSRYEGMAEPGSLTGNTQ